MRNAVRDLIHGDGTAPTILSQVLVAVQKEVIMDARDDDPELVSVRKLSRAAERQSVISDIILCGEPLPQESVEEEATFGVSKESFQPPPEP